MIRAPVAASAIAVALAAAPAVAGGVHGGGGAGGYSALTGPARFGPAAQLELYPGGRFGRFGARLAWLGFEDAAAGLVTAGVTYTAAAARPRLHLALHGELGAAYPDPRAVVGGGVHTQLWIIGPLAIGADTVGLLVLGDGDPSLILGTVLTLRAAW